MSLSQPTVKEKFITLKLASDEYAKEPSNKISQEMIEKQRLSWSRNDAFNTINKKLVPTTLFEGI